MSPPVYRSSYMQNKKASLYGNNVRGVRKLGTHLPRIASGDGDEDWEEKPTKKEERPYQRARRARDIDVPDRDLS